MCTKTLLFWAFNCKNPTENIEHPLTKGVLSHFVLLLSSIQIAYASPGLSLSLTLSVWLIFQSNSVWWCCGGATNIPAFAQFNLQTKQKQCAFLINLKAAQQNSFTYFCRFQNTSLILFRIKRGTWTYLSSNWYEFSVTSLELTWWTGIYTESGQLMFQEVANGKLHWKVCVCVGERDFVVKTLNLIWYVIETNISTSTFSSTEWKWSGAFCLSIDKVCDKVENVCLHYVSAILTLSCEIFIFKTSIQIIGILRYSWPHFVWMRHHYGGARQNEIFFLLNLKRA